MVKLWVIMIVLLIADLTPICYDVEENFLHHQQIQMETSQTLKNVFLWVKTNVTLDALFLKMQGHQGIFSLE